MGKQEVNEPRNDYDASERRFKTTCLPVRERMSSFLCKLRNPRRQQPTLDCTLLQKVKR